jgi:hypothetical protein
MIWVKFYSYACLANRLLKMAGASRNVLDVSESDNKLLIDVNVVLEPPYLPILNFLGKYQYLSPTEG